MLRGNKGASLYWQIASLIRNKIISGYYQPNELLPTEDDFAKHYDVSKTTIRQSLARLESEELILRIPAKGTFVAEDIPVRKQLIVTGNVSDIVRDRSRYEVKCLGINTKKVCETRNPRDIRSFLGFANEDPISIVHRVRLLQNTPIFFIENFMSVDIAKHLNVSELCNKTLLEILKEKDGTAVGRGEMYMEAIPAESDVAEILKLQIFEPLIFFKTYYRYSSGAPFEVVNSFMRADYFKYKVDLTGT